MTKPLGDSEMPRIVRARREASCPPSSPVWNGCIAMPPRDVVRRWMMARPSSRPTRTLSGRIAAIARIVAPAAPGG